MRTTLSTCSRINLRLACVLLTLGGTSTAAFAQTSAPAAAEPSAAPAPAAEPAPAPAEAAAPAPAPAPEPPPAAPQQPLTIAEPIPPAAAPPLPEAAPAAAPAPAAPAPAILIPTGSFFGRYEVRADYDKLGVSRGPRFLESDALFYRARLGLATAPMSVGEDTTVALQFTPQATGVLGTLPNTITDAALNLHEGYMRIHSSAVRFDLGRFELNYGDALVIGNLDWNETGRSFDGMRARYAPEPTGYYVDLFATFVDEGRPDFTAPFAGGDHYFMGLYAGLGPMVTKGMDLDLYALAQLWPTTEGLRVAPMDPTNTAAVDREAAGEVTLGARAKQRIDSFDYRVEAGVQAGSRPGGVPAMPATPPADLESPDVFAYHADAEVGVFVLEDKLRFGLEGMIASGDDPTTTDTNEGWNELYPTAHKFLGLMDVFHQGGQKRTNVMSGVAHVTAKPVADVTLQLDGHVFTRPEAMNAMVDSGYAGAEIDFGAAYALGKGLNVRALYGVFLPGDDFYPVGAVATSADPAHYLEVELRYDLK